MENALPDELASLVIAFLLPNLENNHFIDTLRLSECSQLQNDLVAKSFFNMLTQFWIHDTFDEYKTAGSYAQRIKHLQRWTCVSNPFFHKFRPYRYGAWAMPEGPSDDGAWASSQCAIDEKNNLLLNVADDSVEVYGCKDLCIVRDATTMHVVGFLRQFLSRWTLFIIGDTLVSIGHLPVLHHIPKYLDYLCMAPGDETVPIQLSIDVVSALGAGSAHSSLVGASCGSFLAVGLKASGGVALVEFPSLVLTVVVPSHGGESFGVVDIDLQSDSQDDLRFTLATISQDSELNSPFVVRIFSINSQDKYNVRASKLQDDILISNIFPNNEDDDYENCTLHVKNDVLVIAHAQGTFVVFRKHNPQSIFTLSCCLEDPHSDEVVDDDFTHYSPRFGINGCFLAASSVIGCIVLVWDLRLDYTDEATIPVELV